MKFDGFARLIALVLLVSAASLPAPSFARQPDMAELWNGAQITWREIGPGVREATRTGKPVIMLFHASWCPSCRRYREVWKDPGVVEASRSFVMILIDVDKDPTANGAFSFDGSYVPRTVFLDSEGNRMTDIKGADPEYPNSLDISQPDELRSLMQKAAAKASGGEKQPSEEQPGKEERTSND